MFFVKTAAAHRWRGNRRVDTSLSLSACGSKLIVSGAEATSVAYLEHERYTMIGAA